MKLDIYKYLLATALLIYVMALVTVIRILNQ